MRLAADGQGVATMRARLAGLGVGITGEPEVVRRWALSLVVRVATTDGVLWYKAVPGIFEQEGATTGWLHGRVRGLVPEVVGWGDGWLVTRDLTPGAGRASAHPLGALARLQREVADINPNDVPGLARRSPSSMAAEVQALLARSDAFDARRADRLAAALPVLDAICRAVEECGLPDTVVHGDFQLGNALWTDNGWRLIDWTDAFVGFPLVDLAQPVADGEPGALSACAEQWLPVLEADRLRRAVRLAPAIGAGFHLLMHRRILDEVSRDQHFIESYHMWHARLLGALSEEHFR
ncbi:phosphotransferase family protein [Xylanimonas oleitrophica]|nr:phosphotransferase [Xylanimonas oleitrophica]